MATEKKLPKMKDLEIKPMHFPSTISLDEGDYADVKNWSVGKKYKLELIVKQIGASQDELTPPGDTDSDKVHARFVVEKVLEGEEYTGKEKDDEEDEEKKLPTVVIAVRRKFGKK